MQRYSSIPHFQHTWISFLYLTHFRTLSICSIPPTLPAPPPLPDPPPLPSRGHSHILCSAFSSSLLRLLFLTLSNTLYSMPQQYGHISCVNSLSFLHSTLSCTACSRLFSCHAIC